jgi:hypothetical protein
LSINSTLHSISIENFVKAIIALYEVPTWGHDPSNQLLRLLDRIPQNIIEHIRKLAFIAREITVKLFKEFNITIT